MFKKLCVYYPPPVDEKDHLQILFGSRVMRMCGGSKAFFLSS
jgi:hypothetical protein